MKSSKAKTEKKKWKRVSKERAHSLWIMKVPIRYTNGRAEMDGIWGSCYGPLEAGGEKTDTHQWYRFWVEVE